MRNKASLKYKWRNKPLQRSDVSDVRLSWKGSREYLLEFKAAN